jgi:hypothetical protein
MMTAAAASVVVVGILLRLNQMWDLLPFGVGDLVNMNKLHLRSGVGSSQTKLVVNFIRTILSRNFVRAKIPLN